MSPAPAVTRRRILLSLAAGGVLIGTGAASCAGADNRTAAEPSPSPSPSPSTTAAASPTAASPTATPAPTPTPTPAPGPPLPTVRLPPPVGVVTGLPGPGSYLALTVDDGTSSAVVAAYARFCADTGTRVTFFVNGVNPSWTENAPALRPLVESGQVLLANHTWSHADITRLSAAGLREELTRNDDFLRNTYGVTAQPFLRPPYGYHNRTTDQIAADLGYPTITLWEGSLSDSSIVTEAYLIGLAQRWFLPQHIVIGHANHPAVTHTYPQLLDIISSRGLRTVTLADVWETGR